MIIDTSNWSASDYAAWWGAIVASLALIWNIVVAVRSGPRIVVTATPNMRFFPPDPITEGKSYISLTAVNKGTAPTTITNYCGYYAKSYWDVLKKDVQHFVVNTTALSSPIPSLLKPGEEWRGMLDQEDLESKNEGAKILYVGVAHNQSRKPVYRRVKFSN